MRVLHVSTADIRGGASIAAYRIHKSVLTYCSKEVESSMLVRDRYTRETEIIQVSWLRRWRARLTTKVFRLLLRIFVRSKEYISLGILGCGISDAINKLEPDIVHIHWVQGELIGVKDFQKIKAPVVMTLHDMWPICGVRHYDCGGLYMENRLTRLIEEKMIAMKKREIWKNINVHFTTSWMHEAAVQRGFKANRSFVIPYPGEVGTFYPTSRKSESILKILFGAQGGIQDRRKGFSLLDRALKEMHNEGMSFELHVFGCSRPKNFQRSYKIVFHGVVNDQRKLREIYGRADLMVVPSRAEAFGQTATESIACGTPVVTFEDTGTSSLVRDGKTGYLAKQKDSDSLKGAIKKAIGDRNRLEKMRKMCRTYALENWDEKKVALEYAEMYNVIRDSADI